VLHFADSWLSYPAAAFYVKSSSDDVILLHACPQVVLGWWVPPAPHKQAKQEPKGARNSGTPQLPASSPHLPALPAQASQAQETASQVKAEEEGDASRHAQWLKAEHDGAQWAAEGMPAAMQPATDYPQERPDSEEDYYAQQQQDQDQEMPDQALLEEEEAEVYEAHGYEGQQQEQQQQQQQESDEEGYPNHAAGGDHPYAPAAADEEGAPQAEEDAKQEEQEEDVYGGVQEQVRGAPASLTINRCCL
jgi:hypothetical protein